MLSDPKIIEMLNKETIPLELTLTDHGWPKEMPALNGWKLVYDLLKMKCAFTSCVITTPDGKDVLAGAGDPGVQNWRTSAQYHSDKFEEFLKEGLAKWKTKR